MMRTWFSLLCTRAVRDLAHGGFWLLLACWGAAPAGVADEPRPPNIVLIVADDLGINDLGCYGRREHRTPQLDALAASGTRFTCAYTAQPICSPSRAALLTGKCPARLHLTNYLPGRPDAAAQRLLQPRIEGQLPLEEQTIAEILRTAGYRTGIFGKWHLGNDRFGPDTQGFEVVVSPPANSTPTATEGGKSEYAITQAAAAFMKAHRDEAFFCYVPHHNPHIPLAAPTERIAQNAAAFQPTYAAMLETLDESVGQLLQTVDALGLTEKTIVIFTSDNGGLHVLESPGTPATHNTPYRAGKGFLYEGGLRVPLLVRWRGVVPAGRVNDTPLVLTDLLPTLLEAAGVDVAQTVGPIDGVSMQEVWRGNALPSRPLFWHFPNYTNQGGRPAGAIRRGDWKLIEHFEDGSLELFDLVHDSGEQHNVATANPERAAEMQRELAEWRQRVGAQTPTPNPQFDAALHRRLYIDQDPSNIAPQPTAAAVAADWNDWRQNMNSAVAGQKPRLTPATGDIRLHARDAIIHAETMRYEPQPHKNVLGYWTNPQDWAEWKFTPPQAGIYEIEVQQGCGAGSGGAQVDLEVGGTTLSFTVVDSGHFQQMVQFLVGEVELSAVEQTLAIKPRTKPGVAVMDLRRVVLRPK